MNSKGAWLDRLSVFLEQASKMGLGIISSLFVARHLGPNTFGDLSVLLALATISGSLARLGLDGVLLKKISESQQETKSLLSSGFFLLLAASLINTIFLITYGALSGFDIKNIFALTLIGGSLFFQAFSVLDTKFILEGAARRGALVRTITSFAINGLKILGSLYGLDIIFFATLIPLETALIAIGYVTYTTARATRETLRRTEFNGDSAISLLASGWPLMITTMAVAMYGKLDQILLSHYHGAATTGIYSAATKIYESWIVIPYLLTTQHIPKLVHAKNIGNAALIAESAAMYRFNTWLSFIFCGSIAISSEKFVSMAYGSKYTETAKVLPIVMLSGIAATVISCNTRFLISINCEKQIAIRAISAMAFSVLLNFALIPSHGIHGAALANFAALIFSGFLMDLLPLRGNRELRSVKFEALTRIRQKT